MNKIFLSVIIPCYNEEANIKRGVLAEVNKYLSKQKYAWQVIISDDGSSDQSLSLAERLTRDYKNFEVLKNPHGGKPSALFYGIKKARGEYILFSDMDQSTPISQLEKLVNFTGSDFSAIIGSRGVTRKDFPLYRKLGALVFSTVRRLMILPEIKDTQCGFKLFESGMLKKIFPRLEYFKTTKMIKGWSVSSFDVELLHMVKKQGGKIKEVNVAWSDKDKSKGKGGGIRKYLRESKEMFAQIIRVKINDLKGMY